jgi:TIR domain
MDDAPISMYIVSASQDEILREQLEKHLGLLVKHNYIRIWHRHKAPAGTHVQQEQEAHLVSAALILFLVSADFFQERDAEIQQALAQQRAGATAIIPIMLRAVDLEDAPFAHLQCLPRSGLPIAEHPSSDQAFREIVTEIRAILATQTSQQRQHPEEKAQKLRILLADHSGFVQDRLKSFVGRQYELEELQ